MHRTMLCRTMLRQTMLLAFSAIALVLSAAYAAAQTAPPPPDTLKVDYFEYANTTGAPDSTLHLTNPGTTGATMCAAIYVFDPVEEMTECCSCSLSTNDLRILSVNKDLDSNTATGVEITTGTVSIVSTPQVNGACPTPTSLTPASGGVRAWMTHMDRLRIGGTTSGFVGSVAPSQDATLSSYEQSQLQFACDAIVVVASGAGICTCGTGY
jgi:hypothetical protein